MPTLVIRTGSSLSGVFRLGSRNRRRIAPSRYPSRRMLLVLVWALPAAALIAGCSSDDDRENPATKREAPEFVDMTDQAEVKISIVDNVFEPKNVRVSQGTKIVWSNDGRNDHNVVPSSGTAFQKTELKPGDTFEYVASVAGKLPYYCSIHGSARGPQNGSIEVVAEI